MKITPVLESCLINIFYSISWAGIKAMLVDFRDHLCHGVRPFNSLKTICQYLSGIRTHHHPPSNPEGTIPSSPLPLCWGRCDQLYFLGCHTTPSTSVKTWDGGTRVRAGFAQQCLLGSWVPDYPKWLVSRYWPKSSVDCDLEWKG